MSSTQQISGLDPLLDKALDAIASRSAFSGFQESGSRRFHEDSKIESGRQRFEESLGKPFILRSPDNKLMASEELSPFTGEPLGIQYEDEDVDAVYARADQAMRAWAAVPPSQRVKLCVDLLRDIDACGFEIAHSVMHTAGQSFPMAFAGSGANALDRGLEAVAWAWREMSALPQTARWSKAFGKGEPVALEKRYRIVPRGAALVFCCASYPTWNGYPAIFVNLACGNPVVVKPHPTAVLPMAIAVRVIREGLQKAGHDPDLVQMIVDTTIEPKGKVLIEHPGTAIIDFTGSARFGSWVERNAGGRPCFTETSGVNSVIVESTDDFDAMMDALANTLCLFSAQMCTSPQTFHVPEAGIRCGDGSTVSADEFERALVERIDALAANSQRASSVMGCVQSPGTLALLKEWEQRAQRDDYRVLRQSVPYENADDARARTATPLVLGMDPARHEPVAEEIFGPVAFVIRHPDRDAALALASDTARSCGGLTAFLYSTDESYVDQAIDAFAWAGAALTCNLTGSMPLNFYAAYSDLHVSGLNPAGNATLAEPSFIAGRFRYAQHRMPAGLP